MIGCFAATTLFLVLVLSFPWFAALDCNRIRDVTRVEACGVSSSSRLTETSACSRSRAHTTQQVWRVELAASASGAPYGSFNVSNNGSSGNAYNSAAGVTNKAAAAALRQQAGGPGFPTPQGGSNNGGGGTSSGASARARRYSGAGGPSGPVDPTMAAVSSSSAAGAVGGAARTGRGGGGLRVCGSSMVRCVSPQEGAVVSVHHFNTELGSPLVYGTRKGGVRSWDLRAREVSNRRKRGSGHSFP